MKEHRGSIFVEDAAVIGQEIHEAGQYILRLQAPRCASAAKPGSFVHLTCGPELPMRRPLSIMRASPREGWLEILYKVQGQGLDYLSKRKPGEKLSCMGPIGRGFSPDPARPRCLLLGGGVGIPPMIFLAEALAAEADGPWKPLVLMGSEVPFPFRPRPSTLLIPSMPEGVIASMPLLEGWGVPSRLASRSGFAGCFDGYVTELARAWLNGLDDRARDEVTIFACGPTPMLAACAALAQDFNLPCQVSLEEHMACAGGGCAGCTVLVQTPTGPAMKRVCVDGPVFDALQVFPPAA
ncbi:MAG: dihydroorotate dehydrogenase electron transfer subunit [Steroidobacteraceae bacterium]